MIGVFVLLEQGQPSPVSVFRSDTWGALKFRVVQYLPADALELLWSEVSVTHRKIVGEWVSKRTQLIYTLVYYQTNG